MSEQKNYYAVIPADVRYRRHYENITNKKVPSNFDIHHLDKNRENNNINNLVALPRQTHKNLHKYDNIDLNVKLHKIPKGIIEGGNGYLYYMISQLTRYSIIYESVSKWIDYRDYLLDRIIDYHNIKDYKEN